MDENKTVWGWELQLDLYNCNAEKIRDAKTIKKFVRQLCKKIEMTRFGTCKVVHFGEDEKVAGFSMTQLISTSLISAHFANQTNTTYLNVFSCKQYDKEKVIKFAMKFFESDKYIEHFTERF